MCNAPLHIQGLLHLMTLPFPRTPIQHFNSQEALKNNQGDIEHFYDIFIHDVSFCPRVNLCCKILVGLLLLFWQDYSSITIVGRIFLITLCPYVWPYIAFSSEMSLSSKVKAHYTSFWCSISFERIRRSTSIPSSSYLTASKGAVCGYRTKSMVFVL